VHSQVQADSLGSAYLEFSPLDEGLYRITAQTELPTMERSLSSPEQIVVIDRTPPSLVLSEPTEPQVTKKEIVVSGRTEPNTLLELNGEAVALDDGGHFEHLLQLESGSNELELVATDLAGNSIRLGSVIIYE